MLNPGTAIRKAGCQLGTITTSLCLRSTSMARRPGRSGLAMTRDCFESESASTWRARAGGWTHVIGPGITQFFSVAASNGGGTLQVLGGARRITARHLGGLANWRDIYGGDGGFVAIDPTNSNIVSGGSIDLKILDRQTLAFRLR